MKYIICLLAVAILLVATAFTPKKKKEPVNFATAKYFEKKLKKVKADLYAWDTETSNLEYNTYLNEIMANGKNYKSFALDTFKWNETLYSNAPYVKYYHTNKAFNNYPLVNISYENAIAYCNWLTETYNNKENKKFTKVEFTLPTETEWMYAASGGDITKKYPWKANNTFSEKGFYYCNVKGSMNYGKLTYDTAVLAKIRGNKYYTSDVSSQWRGNKLYNVVGNVAEMLIDKGFSKGGSYNTDGAVACIQTKESYTSSNPETGFRVFMRVITP